MLNAIKNSIYHTLRWSERFTKIDMVYLASGSFWVILGQFFTNILSLVLVYIFANYLSKETYGIYQYAIAIVSILSVFTLTGMNRAVSQAVSQGEDGVLRATVRYQLRWNLVMWLATACASGYYYLQGDPQLAAVLAIMGFFAPLTAAFLTYGSFLEGKRKFSLNAFFGTASTLIYVAGMAFVVLGGGSLVSMAAIYALTAFLAAILFYVITIKIFNPPISDATSAITYGWKLTFIGFFAPIVTHIDKVIVASFWGAADLAVYAIATMIPNKMTTSVKSWLSVGFPKLATRTPEELDATFYRRVFYGMATGGLIAITYIVLAPYLFAYLLPQYTDAVFYSQLLAVSLIFALPNRYVSLLLEAHKFAKIIFINNTGHNILRAALYITLGVWGGVLGLVMAQVLHNFLAMFINIAVWRFRKQ